MTVNSGQREPAASSWLRLIPGLVLGLFIGRWVSEQIHPSLLGAVLITLLFLALFSFVVSRFSFGNTWPSLFLTLYIVYPEADPRIALTAAALCLVAFTADRKTLALVSGRQRFFVLSAGALLLGLFGWIYLSTIAPDVLPADSGEFQLMATQLGIPHPPGFALYTMLAHLMTRLPFSATPAFKVNLLSPFLAIATLLLIYRIVLETTRSIPAALSASVALGVSTTFWAQATSANIRSMTAFFAALILLAAVKLLTLRQSERVEEGSGYPGQPSLTPAARRWLILFVLALGLGIGHHLSLAFLCLIMTVLVLVSYRFIFHQPRTLLLLAGVTALTLLPLLYIPFRAAAGAIGSSPELLTLRGFLNHALALGFQGDLFYVNNPGIIWERLQVIGNVATFQFPVITLVAIIIGLGFVLWRDRRLGIMLTGGTMIYVLVAASYRAPQTVEYLMPAYVLAVVALGYLIGSILKVKPPGDKQSPGLPLLRSLSAVTAAILLVTALNQAVDNYPSYALLHEDQTARDYALPLLTEAPPESTILADWHWVTPIWYLQEVEGLGQDRQTEFVFPTGEKYADTWARRIQEESAAGHPVIATHFAEAAYQNLPVAFPFHEAFLFDSDPLLELPAGFQSLQLRFGQDIAVLGYRLEDSRVTAANEIVLSLAWKPMRSAGSPLNLYAHLIGPDGRLVGQDDEAAKSQPDGLAITQFRLFPWAGLSAGDYTLQIGAYAQEPIPDQEGNVGTSIATVSISPAPRPQATLNRRYRPLADSSSGKRLIGFDTDNTLTNQRRLYLHWQDDQGYITETIDLAGDTNYDLPTWIGPWGREIQGSRIKASQESSYVPFGRGIIWTGPMTTDARPPGPGQDFPVTADFLSSQPVLRDMVVSIRLVGYQADGFHWAWWDLSDNVPALGAIPTLKWIAGSRVHDPHWPAVTDEAPSGQVIEPLLRLYDAFTGRPLQILDERIYQLAPWIPLGKTTVE